MNPQGPWEYRRAVYSTSGQNRAPNSVASRLGCDRVWDRFSSWTQWRPELTPPNYMLRGNRGRCAFIFSSVGLTEMFLHAAQSTMRQAPPMIIKSRALCNEPACPVIKITLGLEVNIFGTWKGRWWGTKKPWPATIWDQQFNNGSQRGICADEHQS